MPILLYTNNAQSTLAGSISDSATTCNLQSGGGARFPNPGAGEGFYATFTDAATGLLREVVLVNTRSGDTITSMTRAQQGTVALAWAANDLFAKLWTAGDAEAMLQQGQAQAQSTNYANDIGVVNAYQCNLNPAISSPVEGMPIRVKIANTNTTASTLNPGPGAAAILRRDGSALIGGELVAGDIVEFKWDGTNYRIEGVAPASNAVTLAQTDTQSAITPASLKSAFPVLFASDGYVVFPGAVGNRVVIEWGQAVVNSGTTGTLIFPLAMTGGLTTIQITPNFNVGGMTGGYGTNSGSTAGFNLQNATNLSGNWFWFATGRV